jgi:hypothetical protein
MIPRPVLLRQPHMQSLQGHPALNAMSDRELRALEAFMLFCTDNRLSDPGGVDIQAFACLHDQAPQTLLDLGAALRQLGMGEEFLAEIQTIYEAQRHKAEFKGVTKGPNRDYKRSVSLPVEALPADWQKTLRRLRVERTFTNSTLTRMESRLGMFAWSAQQAGQPVDLGDIAALQALYADMRARSAAKNGGTPRWSYLRGTWEELRRFARAHGLPEAVWDTLSGTYHEMARLEDRQEPNKFAKMREIGTQTDLIEEAEQMLAKAELNKSPSRRHVLRNRATAIVMGCLVPARPQDVEAHHVFGQGLTFEPGRNAYRFRYIAGKTRTTTGDTVNLPLLPRWNKFIDALILQDQDPRYLGQLRAKVIADQRPLYVQYDGTPAVYAWYSRMWSIVAGTGGHIARTLAYDAGARLGEDGIQVARIQCGHRPDSPIVAKYSSEAAAKALIEHSQDIMAGLGGDEVEDISDLL